MIVCLVQLITEIVYHLLCARRVLRGLFVPRCLHYCMARGKHITVGQLHVCGQERILTTCCDYRAEGKINKRTQGREPDYSLSVVTKAAVWTKAESFESLQRQIFLF